MIRDAAQPGVDVVPHFITSPVSVLAVTLLDLIGPLAMRVAAIDGVIDPAERETIATHFTREWGYDSTYVKAALDLHQEASATAEVRPLARALAEFQAANPDCNVAQMHADLIALLREVAAADRRLDERETMAIDAIAGELASARAFSAAAVVKSAGTAIASGA